MDARLDPAQFAGLAEGDAHVIRNAGGRASDDAIRSLVISYKLLGTREWFVIHHTNCGMEFFTNDVMRGLLANSLETAALTDKGFQDVGKGPGSRAGEFIEWLTIHDEEQSVRDDVQRIREHPLVSKKITIYGYVYDVKSGRLLEVREAKRPPKAAAGLPKTKPSGHPQTVLCPLTRSASPRQPHPALLDRVHRAAKRLAELAICWVVLCGDSCVFFCSPESTLV